MAPKRLANRPKAGTRPTRRIHKGIPRTSARSNSNAVQPPPTKRPLPRRTHTQNELLSSRREGDQLPGNSFNDDVDHPMSKEAPTFNNDDDDETMGESINVATYVRIPPAEPLMLPNIQVLQEANQTVDCQFMNASASLRICLQVHNDYYGLSSRLGYRVIIYLNRAAAGTLPAIANAEVGFIQAWRVSKPTDALPSLNADAWKVELLRPAIRSISERPTTETEICIKSLFTREGHVRQKHAGRLPFEELNDKSLMFIESVYLKRAYQNQRLLQHILPTFHTMLGTALAEWFSFAGCITLMPAGMNGKRGEGWGDLSVGEIEGILIALYGQAQHGYSVWVQDEKIGPVITTSGQRGKRTESFYLVTIMGRIVP